MTVTDIPGRQESRFNPVAAGWEQSRVKHVHEQSLLDETNSRTRTRRHFIAHASSRHLCGTPHILFVLPEGDVAGRSTACSARQRREAVLLTYALASPPDQNPLLKVGLGFTWGH